MGKTGPPEVSNPLPRNGLQMHYAPGPYEDNRYRRRGFDGSYGRHRCNGRLLLSKPIPVYNVDGTPNEAGSINEVVDVIMTYNGHSERIMLAVTRLGKQSMILGFTWLDKHNPEIDFRAKTVKMTRCLPRCCSGCQLERKEERTRKKEQSRRINACRTGPFPRLRRRRRRRRRRTGNGTTTIPRTRV